MLTARRRRACETPQDVAALAERNRRALLGYAALRYPTLPSDIREEVLQEVVADLALDDGVRGPAEFVRACLYKRLDSRLSNRRVHEHAERLVRGESAEQFMAIVVDPDTRTNPEVRAVESWHRRVLDDLLGSFSEVEQKVIRLRYRGGERARKSDGTVSRRECADLLGLTVAEVRAIEDRVASTVDGAVAAYETSCEQRVRDVSRAAQTAAGRSLDDVWDRSVAAGRRHIRACGHCAQVFHEERIRFAREIAVAIPLPVVAHDSSIADRAAAAFSSVREAIASGRRSVMLLLRDPATSVQFSTPRGSGVALLAACGAIGGTAAGVCGVTGFNPLGPLMPPETPAAVATARTTTSPASASQSRSPTATIVFSRPAPLGTLPPAASPTTASAPSPALPEPRPRAETAVKDACEACAERKTARRQNANRRESPSVPPEVPAAAAAAVQPTSVTPPSTPAAVPAAPATSRTTSVAGAPAATSRDLCEACAERSR